MKQYLVSFALISDLEVTTDMIRNLLNDARKNILEEHSAEESEWSAKAIQVVCQGEVSDLRYTDGSTTCLSCVRALFEKESSYCSFCNRFYGI